MFLAIKRIAFLIKTNHSWKNIYAEGPAGHSHNSQLLKLWNWYLRRSYNVLFFLIKKVPHNVSAEFITHTHVWDLHQASHSQCETTRLDTEATVCNERSKPNTSFKWDRQHVSGFFGSVFFSPQSLLHVLEVFLLPTHLIQIYWPLSGLKQNSITSRSFGSGVSERVWFLSKFNQQTWNIFLTYKKNNYCNHIMNY